MTRAALVAVVGLVACHRGPRLPEATGTLLLELDVKTPNADAILATAAEVLRSETLIGRVVEEHRLPRPDHVEVHRRTESFVLAVTVAAPDPVAAEQFCNDLMQMYVAFRMDEQLAPVEAERAAIQAKLDDPKTQNRDDLMKAQLELGLQIPRNDVRLIDPCKVAR